MEKSLRILGDYSVFETKKQGLASRLERALQQPEKVEICKVTSPSDILNHLSIAIGDEKLSDEELTLNPFDKKEFNVEAKIFSPCRSILRDDGKWVDMRFVGFDAYKRGQTEKVGSIIVLKADVDTVSRWPFRSRLTVRDIEWGENCTYGAYVMSDDAKWFRMSHREADNDEPSSVPLKLEVIDPRDERAVELDTELEEFLREHEFYVQDYHKHYGPLR